MKADYDYAIVGAGCSGLSMALHLRRRLNDDARLLLIDPRQSFDLDRIWCFWNTHAHPFTGAVQHQWSRWKARHRGREVTHASKRFAYQYLPADAFYHHALSQLRNKPSVDLRLNTAAQSITTRNGVVQVATDKGDILARLAFDGRNDPQRWQGRGLLLQHYAGQRVRVAEPVFDPAVMTLMDFDVPQTNGISFVYVLPFSATEALIEPTIFSTVPLETTAYSELIQGYLHERFGIAEYDIVFQEKGVIPMSADLAPPTHLGRVTPLGTGAGMVKGSTGYGFLAIQHWSQVLAEAAGHGPGTPLAPPRPPLAMFMDRVFLAFLEARPKAAPTVFFNLFDRVVPDRLVRFLSDQATPTDVAAVVAAMPKAPFIGQALKVLARRPS